MAWPAVTSAAVTATAARHNAPPARVARGTGSRAALSYQWRANQPESGANGIMSGILVLMESCSKAPGTSKAPRTGGQREGEIGTVQPGVVQIAIAHER